MLRILQPNTVPLLGYDAIARHYKWALDQVFTKLGFESVIILEGMPLQSLENNLLQRIWKFLLISLNSF